MKRFPASRHVHTEFSQLPDPRHAKPAANRQACLRTTAKAVRGFAAGVPMREAMALGVVLACALNLAFWACAGDTAANPASATPNAGDSVDIAPWAERVVSSGGDEISFRWEDPRDVRRVLVVFDGPAPELGNARLQWWQSQWPERRIPRDHLSGAGESGWLDIGDWYRGGWRDADSVRERAGNTWSFSFRSINASEFPRLKDFSADYRTTMKLRLLLGSRSAKPTAVRVLSDSTWKSADVVVEWGGTAKERQVWDGHLEIFNGAVDQLQPMKPGVAVSLGPAGEWRSQVQNGTAGIRFRVWFTQSPNVNSFDRTAVTVRAKQHSLSFDAAEVATGRRVFIPMYGVLVRLAEDNTGYDAVAAQLDQHTTKTFYERVFEEPEQTYARARADMPPKRQFYFPLGCEGGRQRFGVEPDGAAFCVNDRIDQPVGKDTKRRTWGGNRLRYTYGLPPGTANKRSLEDGCLPIIHAQWEKAGVRYSQTAFATRLDPGGLGYPEMHADDTTVLIVRLVVENVGTDDAPVSLPFGLQADNRAVELLLRDGLVMAQVQTNQWLRAAFDVRSEANVTVENGQIVFSGSLPVNEQAELVLKIPFITLDQPADVERLRSLTFDDEYQRVKTFWRQRADAAAQVRTPVEDITDFYRALTSHLMINCGREVGSDRLMARVGGFAYGVYGNESCMMITELDRRGLHQEAERCLDTFFRYQGSAALPGDFSTREGVFNGAGGWESGGYNQHHGWILWAMAEHYWYSGDADWLRAHADQLLKACQWIIRERARSAKFDPSSQRGIERGLLPPGSLEDIGDWRCWMSNNGFSWWGLDAVAKALASVGHPEAGRMQAEADAFHKDLLAAFHEAMIRAPVVGLRDGSYIPQIPSEVHRRGRTYGWITTTLEGSIYLIRTGAIPPNDPMAVPILQDFEDNLYLSEQFGYSPARHLDHWFSQGGFSMQPNLLCSPQPYLMRDEVKHFLRAYFNAFAVGFYANTRMLTEHPLPEMEDWRGDHYKSSDESNSAYWLRLMFIDEREPDLYLGSAIPRAWLADGGTPGIERGATRFGPMSLRFASRAAQGTIQAVLNPPTRRAPKHTWLRIRHPEQKPILRVTVNDQPWTRFDARQEWIELPNLPERMTIKAFYGAP